jgi:23S rRNA pseudouridine1911/1915/1917 synthase
VGSALKVLYEDPALLIAEKPYGIHTAPLSHGAPDTFLALVLASFPEVSSVPGIKPSEPGLLHRLDRDTSGVVVIARTPRAFAGLRAQFAAFDVEKEYDAACMDRVDMAKGGSLTIQSRFAASGPGRRRVHVVMPDETNRKLLREAGPVVYQTVIRIQRLHGDRALVRVVIRKGFRHQIRAHLAFVGLPIFGDVLYGVRSPPDAPQRMFLHARRISFIHPVTGKPLRVSSELPQEFDEIMRSGKTASR